MMHKLRDRSRTPRGGPASDPNDSGHVPEHPQPIGRRAAGRAKLVTAGAHKRTEEAPHPTDKRFRALIEKSADGIALFTVDRTVLYVSPAISRILGFETEEFLGRNLFEWMHPDDLASTTHLFEQLLLRPGESISTECRNRHKDGSWRWIECTLTNLLDEPSVQAIVSNVRDLTEHMQTQAALAEALRERENIMETIPDVLYTLDLEGRVVKWNRKLEQVSGLSADEIHGLSALEFFPDEDKLRVAEAIAAVFQTGYGGVEAPMLHRDGSRVPYHYTGVPLKNAAGTVIGMTGVGRDVTERKRAEHQTAVLLEVATTIAGTLDMTELVDRVQRQTAQVLPCDGVAVFQIDAATGVSRMIAQYGLPADLLAAIGSLEFASGEPFGGRLANGETFVLNDLTDPAWLPEVVRTRFPLRALVATPLRVRGRGLGAFVAFNTAPARPFLSHHADLVRGIAQQLAVAMQAAELFRVQQEEAEVSAALARVGRETIAMLDTPALLDRLCELTTELLQCDYSHTWLWQPEDDAFVAVSAHGDPLEHWEALRTVKLSRAMIHVLLEQLEQVDLVHLGMSGLGSAPLSRMPAAYGITAGVVLALRRGGEIVGLHTAGYRGRQAAFSARQERIAGGIAQLGSLALQSARLVGELERANRLKSEFVATMSHELRTPLNIILGYNDLVLEEVFGPLTPEQTETLQRVNANARTLLELITATLDMSRLDSGRLPLQLCDVDPLTIIREIQAETSELHEEKPQVRFTWSIAATLPRLCTDAAKVKVVLKNLISNAIKFTEEGAVAVSVDRRDEGIEVRVVDTGIGIESHMQRTIFEPFRQADSSATRRYGGVGLGLYIVHRLVEMLGGSISVESAIGRGSTFRVWLPVQCGRA